MVAGVPELVEVDLGKDGLEQEEVLYYLVPHGVIAETIELGPIPGADQAGAPRLCLRRFVDATGTECSNDGTPKNSDDYDPPKQSEDTASTIGAAPNLRDADQAAPDNRPRESEESEPFDGFNDRRDLPPFDTDGYAPQVPDQLGDSSSQAGQLPLSTDGRPLSWLPDDDAFMTGVREEHHDGGTLSTTTSGGSNFEREVDRYIAEESGEVYYFSSDEEGEHAAAGHVAGMPNDTTETQQQAPVDAEAAPSTLSGISEFEQEDHVTHI
ncbi:hypothetical protein Slin14017_G126690 [Septoria linicola]|nr:hypothetical protein Slin14017_G126690 [Septoria linicola]